MSEASLRWYAAVLVLQSEVLAPTSDEPLVDHQIRVILASDPNTAYERALFLGRAEEHTYTNAYGQTVVWKFIGLHDLCELETAGISDTAEVYSFLTRSDHAWRALPKEQLTVFWSARNQNRDARELLD